MTRRRQFRWRAKQKAHLHKKGPAKITIRKPQLIAGALAVALAFDSTGMVRIGLLCAALHECGHIAVYRMLAGEWPSLVLAPGEVRMRMPNDCLTAGQELLVAGAGVAVNLLGCVGALLMMECRFGYSYAGYWFAADNVLLAGLNLLPLHIMDGGRMLGCARQMKGA